MAVLRLKDMRELDEASLYKKLSDLSDELNSERSRIAAGGKPASPGRVKEVRRTIARILTVKREREQKKGGSGAGA